MSHLTQSMVEQFFAREEENARGVLRKEMDSAMDTIFKQMKLKLMQLVESGPEPDDTAHGLDHLGVTIDREQQLSNDTKHIPSNSVTTNSHVHLNKMSIASNLYQNVLVDGKEQLYEGSNQIASTSTNVDDVTSNTEKGSENSGTDLEGQEGEHSANDSNEQSQSSDLLAHSTSTGQRSNRIDVSWSPSQTVQSPNDSHIKQEHLNELVDNEPQLYNEDTSTRVDHGTTNNEKGNENGSIVLKGQEGEHMANDSNDQTVAQSSDALSPSTSIGRRSNRIAEFKKQLPADHNVTKQKEPSSNRSVKKSKKTIEGDVGENEENELVQMGSGQSEAEFWFDEDDEDCDCSECMDDYCVWCDECISQLAVDLDQGNHSGSRPTKRARLENDQEQGAMLESSDNAPHVPSTSTVRKRQSSSLSRSVNNKPHKTVTTRGSKKCKSPGCGKSFRDNYHLTQHERIHLGIKPFSCTWPGCRYSTKTKGNVVLHVRTKHFKLPQLQAEQTRLNIVDNRNPEDYVQVNDQLLERRLD